MGMYKCYLCDTLCDDDYIVPMEYGTELICEGCVDVVLDEVTEVLGSEEVDQMQLEDIVAWHHTNR